MIAERSRFDIVSSEMIAQSGRQVVVFIRLDRLDKFKGCGKQWNSCMIVILNSSMIVKSSRIVMLSIIMIVEIVE